jgi:L-asparagine oxygenase
MSGAVQSVRGSVSEREAQKILRIAREIAERDYMTDTEGYIRQAQLESANLPEWMRRSALDFVRFGDETGAMMMSGLPIGALPETPASADAARYTQVQAAAVLMLVASLLGQPYGYTQEMGGLPIQYVLPVPGAEATEMSVGSEKEITDHTEMVFMENNPQYVVLLCARADHEGIAGTTVAPIESILKVLDAHTVEVLHTPVFTTRIDESFVRGAGWGETRVGGVAALTGPSERPRIHVDFAETRSTTPEGNEALSALRRAVWETRLEVRMRPGDLIAIDNRYAMHGRTPFVPRYDGNDRWLLRTFVTRDLEPSVEGRPDNGRIIDVDYTQDPRVIHA